MSIFDPLIKGFSAWLPMSCLLCGEDGGAAAVCPACTLDLPRLAPLRCPLCALPTGGGEVCGGCLRHRPHYDATVALYRYAHPADKLIHALKYERRLASAEFLCQELSKLADADRPNLVLPVPLAAARLAERGFNQAVELARPLARRLDLPLELSAVRRVRHTVAQARLPWKQRQRNIRHAFECTRDLGGLSIWVIDDVMTTGATLNELARILKLHGARRVENRVVARAVPT